MHTDNSQSDPHHVNKNGHGAMGSKTDDTRCIPLCHKHHVELHQKGGETFRIKYQLDYEYIIMMLNKMYKELQEE